MSSKKITRTMIYAIAIAAGCYFIYNLYLESQTNIQTIDSYTQAAQDFSAADSNTLILFDIDQTLIESASLLFRSKNKNRKDISWLDELTNEIYGLSNKPESYFGSIWREAENPILIEPHIAQTIKELQHRGVKVMALTALKSGSNYIIRSLPEWRYRNLKAIGIDFNLTGFPDIIFTEFPQENNTYPELYHGLLCTNGVSKGDLVGAFLDRLQWRPDKVLFFDDVMKHVVSLEHEMRKRSIPFQGFEYRGAEHITEKLDEDLALFQLTYLIRHEKWLNDDQARLLMNTSKQKDRVNTHIHRSVRENCYCNSH